jgi:DNA-binding MarR family transcriptional regulator
LLLADGHRLTIGDIAELQATSSTNVTKLINRMQHAGFVRRVPDSGDKRVIWVELTSVGRERYVATMPTSSLDREAFGVLSSAELTILIDMLARVRREAMTLNQDQLTESPVADSSSSVPAPSAASSGSGAKALKGRAS